MYCDRDAQAHGGRVAVLPAGGAPHQIQTGIFLWHGSMDDPNRR